MFSDERVVEESQPDAPHCDDRKAQGPGPVRHLKPPTRGLVPAARTKTLPAFFCDSPGSPGSTSLPGPLLRRQMSLISLSEVRQGLAWFPPTLRRLIGQPTKGLDITTPTRS